MTKAVVAICVVFVSTAGVVAVTVPRSVVLLIPPLFVPMVMLVVEPATPPVPMLTVLVEPLIVAPVASPVVPDAVPVPKLFTEAANVFAPVNVLLFASVGMVCVIPLSRTNKLEAVVHRSPLTGDVGAVPCGRLSPAPPVAEATVFSLPVSVPPASGR